MCNFFTLFDWYFVELCFFDWLKISSKHICACSILKQAGKYVFSARKGIFDSAANCPSFGAACLIICSNGCIFPKYPDYFVPPFPIMLGKVLTAVGQNWLHFQSNERLGRDEQINFLTNFCSLTRPKFR